MTGPKIAEVAPSSPPDVEQRDGPSPASAACATSASPDAEWHAWRAQGIGGSDVAALLGLSRYASSWSLWAEKTGLLPRDATETPRQRIGKRMESVLALEFHDETGLYVAGEQTWCSHRDHPEYRCTVDGFVVERDLYTARRGDLPDRIGTVQMKTDGRHSWPDGVPANIRAQCLWELYVTDLHHCWLVVLHAGFKVKVYEIARDAEAEADIAFMVAKAAEFWAQVQDGNPPPLDGSEPTADAIAAIWPEHRPGTVCHAGEQLATLLTSRVFHKARIKEHEETVDEIDNEIACAVADDEEIWIDGNPAWSYRSQSRATVDRAALERDHPELAAAYTRQSTFRVLRKLTPKKEKSQ